MKLQLFDDNGVNDIHVNILIQVDAIFAHEYGIYKVTYSDPDYYIAERIKNSSYSDLFFKLSNDLFFNASINKKGNIIIKGSPDRVFEIIENIDYDRFIISRKGKKIVIS